MQKSIERSKESNSSKQKKLSYKACHITSFVCDIINFIIYIVDMSLYLPINQIDKSEHIIGRIFQLLVLFTINHMPGYFAFMYVYLPAVCFPLLQMQQQNKTIFYLEIVEWFLMLISFGSKLLGKMIMRPILQLEAQWLNAKYKTDIYAVNSSKNYGVCINLIISNIVSTMLIQVLVNFDINETVINRKVLYSCGLFFAFIAFLIPYYIYVLTNSEMLNKFRVILHDKQQRQEYKKTSMYGDIIWILFNFFVLLIIGTVLASLVDAVFSSWIALSVWTQTQSFTYYPTFSTLSARSLSALLLSIGYTIVTQYALFLRSPCGRAVINECAVNYSSKFTDVVKQMSIQVSQVLKVFQEVYYQISISSTIIAFALLLLRLTDILQLTIQLFSGAALSGSILIAMQIVSTIIILAMLALYLLTLYNAQKRKNQKPWFQFILGYVSVCSLLSINYIFVFLGNMFTCSLQPFLYCCLVQVFIPILGIMIWLQASPNFYPHIKPKELRVLEKEEKELIDIVGGKDELAPLLQTTVVEDKDDIKFEELKQAAKFMYASYVGQRPNKFYTKMSALELQKCAKLGIIVEQNEQTLFVGVRGTDSVLDFGANWVVRAIPQWGQLIFGPFVELKFDEDEKSTFVNYLLLKKAQGIINIIQKCAAECHTVVLSGHHQGASIALLAANILSESHNDVRVYCLGMPMQFSDEFLNFVAKRVHVVNLHTSSKLYVSGLLTSELRYSSSRLISYSEKWQNDLREYAVLNAGGSKEQVFTACLRIWEENQKINVRQQLANNSIVSQENKDHAFVNDSTMGLHDEQKAVSILAKDIDQESDEEKHNKAKQIAESVKIDSQKKPKKGVQLEEEEDE